MIRRTQHCYEVVQYDDAERYVITDDTGTSLGWRSREGRIDVLYGWAALQQPFTAAGSAPVTVSFECVSTK